MYNKGDTSFKLQPKIMSVETLDCIATEINLHVRKHNIGSIFIVFHGGEPMLAGIDFFINAVKIFNEKIDVKINYAIQTNGTLLNKDWVVMFSDLSINVGISIDGPKKYHDEFRKFHNEKGSFETIMDNFNDKVKVENFGFLFVVNPLIPVGELYLFIKESRIGTLNLLLPDHHYDDLPSFNDVKLADWLIDFYQLWRNDTNRPYIDFFENIIKSFFNLSSGTQILGSCLNSVVCIETNGSIEVIDSLRTCESGITRNSLNVKNNRIDDIFTLPIYQKYYFSHKQVSDTCLKCELLETCGGGFLPHRYSKTNGFDNPSIYCNDLFTLIKFIELDVKTEINRYATN